MEVNEESAAHVASRKANRQVSAIRERALDTEDSGAAETATQEGTIDTDMATHGSAFEKERDAEDDDMNVYNENESNDWEERMDDCDHDHDGVHDEHENATQDRKEKLQRNVAEPKPGSFAVNPNAVDHTEAAENMDEDIDDDDNSNLHNFDEFAIDKNAETRKSDLAARTRAQGRTVGAQSIRQSRVRRSARGGTDENDRLAKFRGTLSVRASEPGAVSASTPDRSSEGVLSNDNTLHGIEEDSIISVHSEYENNQNQSIHDQESDNANDRRNENSDNNITENGTGSQHPIDPRNASGDSNDSLIRGMAHFLPNASNEREQNNSNGVQNVDTTTRPVASEPESQTQPRQPLSSENQMDRNRDADDHLRQMESGQVTRPAGVPLEPYERDTIDGIQAFVAQTPSSNAVDAIQVTAVKSEAEEEREEERKRRRYLMIGGVCLCVIIIAIVVPTAVVLSRKGEGADSLVDITESPTTSPSSAPTSSLFAEFVDVISGLYDDEESFSQVFSNVNSPQYKAAQWTTEINSLQLLPSDRRMVIRYSLATFYYATEGESWQRCRPDDVLCLEDERWLAGFDECQWFMISCSDDGEVTQIFSPTRDMQPVGMAGTLPFELSFLTGMELLVLSFNSIGGSFPPSLAQLTTLKSFIVTQNQFTGFPGFFFTDRMSLTTIQLSENPLNTSLPEIVYNSTTLSLFRAPSSSLTGTIPSQISGLVELDVLDLSNNTKLTGEIPTEAYTLPLLSLLLNNNYLLGGSLPDEIGQLTKLTRLDLRNSTHSGELPSSFFEMTSLQDVWLSNCSFTGTISAEGFSRLEMASEILLNDNQFTGEFPSDTFANLSFLNRLEVHNNSVVGSVTPELCAQQGDSRVSIQSLSVDCEGDPPEVFCDCCEGCFVDS